MSSTNGRLDEGGPRLAVGPSNTALATAAEAAAPDEETDGPLRRLDDILRALPPSELNALIRRLGIRIDPQKRIDIGKTLCRGRLEERGGRGTSKHARQGEDGQ